MCIPEKEERKEQKKICETTMIDNFPKLMLDTKSQIQEKTSRINAKQKQHQACHFQTPEKPKIKEKYLERSQRGKPAYLQRS